MDQRIFGNTGVSVSALGLGCARIGGIFQKDPGGFERLLRSAVDAGITFFDTADMYSQGESEKLLGRVLRKDRQRLVIASKAGYVLPAQRRLIGAIKPLVRPLIKLLKLRRDRLPASVRGELTQDFSPKHLRGAVEASLRRLQTDRLDFLQLHSPPAAIVARGEWLPAVEELKRAGKIRFYGVACDDVAAALAALEHPGVSSLQITINLLEQGAIDALLPAARAKNVGVIAREILANGLLIKPAAEVDLKTYCKSPEESARREQQLAAVGRLAAAAGATPAQLALQLVEHLEGVPVALIGARTPEQLAAVLELRRASSVPADRLRTAAT